MPIKKFKEWVESKNLNEDPLQAMHMLKQQMAAQQQGGGEQSPSTLGGLAKKAALMGGKALGMAAVDTVTGGVGSHAVEITSMLIQFIKSRQQTESQSMKRLEGVIQQYSKLNIPEGTLDFNDGIFAALSNQSLLLVFSDALNKLSQMNGDYSNARNVFNEVALMHIRSIFGKAKGSNAA